ncbi:MAG: FG-GAP-like repeat-containing protein [Planctomycetaceae bacterium]
MGVLPRAAYILFMQNDGTVKSHQKVSDTQGGFTGTLNDYDNFGRSLVSLGDLDGDGVADLAVGTYRDDSGGSDRGAVYVLFLNSNGTVKAHQKISDTEGGFTALFDDADVFGGALASRGDLDGDGVNDLVVGATGDDDGGSARGAIYLLYMNTDGTVKSHRKISNTAGGFTGSLDNNDRFGGSVESLGDLNGDGVSDLAVGAYGDDDGGNGRGAVYVLFMNADGTVNSSQKISDTQGNFQATLDDVDTFGNALTNLGDLDGDGISELVVGALNDDDGGTGRGAVFILSLEGIVPPEVTPIGTVTAEHKISDTAGSFTGMLDDYDEFGTAVADLGDLDGDGINDMAVGASHDSDGGIRRGAVYVLFMNADGTVKSHQKISDTLGGFTGLLDDDDRFGFSVANLGDLNGDGVTDIAVGAERDDDGGQGRGAVYVLFLNNDGTVEFHQKISDTEGNFAGSLGDFDYFGTSVTSLGDLDGDGVSDLAVGTRRQDQYGYFPGAIYVLMMNPNGTVKSHQKIDDQNGGFTGTLDAYDFFGSSLANLGDLDGDGVTDLAVGASGDKDGGYYRGAVHILFLNTNGTVKSHQTISDTEGNFTATLDDNDHFGRSVTNMGDLDGDGVPDLVVGAYRDDDGGDYDRGAVYVLFLNTDGTVKSHQKISDTEGNLSATLDDFDNFGRSVANIGDLDGDGLVELAIGASLDDDGGSNRGAVHILSLEQVTPPDVTPPTITSLTPSITDGTMQVGTTVIDIDFSESVLGGDQASNFEVRSQGADGILGNGDDVIVALSASYAANTSTLTFAGLTEGVYRLTAKDTLTDIAVNALDGDADTTAGGDFVRDFVVGALTQSLTSPNGFEFDVEFAGYGAGQLVQGTGNAFDGLNRLQVGDSPYNPVLPSAEFVNITQASGLASGDDVNGWQTVSGLSVSYTGDGDPVRLQSSITASALSPSGAGLQFRFTVDGIGRAPVGMAYFPPSQNIHIPMSFEEFVDDLAPGMHVIELQAAPAPGFSTSDTYFGWQSGSAIRVYEFNSIPDVGMDDDGRTVISPTQVMDGLDVSREVTVPSTGTQDFARTVDVLHNPTGSPISTTVKIVGNLGSDAATNVFATSSGDSIVQATDQWIGTDDADGTGTPAIIHYIHGPLGLVPATANVIGDNIEWTYNVTVPAGETLRLAHFTILADTRANAIAAANATIQLYPRCRTECRSDTGIGIGERG